VMRNRNCGSNIVIPDFKLQISDISYWQFSILNLQAQPVTPQFEIGSPAPQSEIRNYNGPENQCLLMPSIQTMQF
jgi:hypothetical protein